MVTKLGEYAKDRSQYSIFLYILFAILNIGVTAAFILYLVRKILKPILVLTSATSEVKSGNLNVVIKSKGNGDELSVLTESFNSMVTSIKNYIKKQKELKKELEKANEELKQSGLKLNVEVDPSTGLVKSMTLSSGLKPGDPAFTAGATSSGEKISKGSRGADGPGALDNRPAPFNRVSLLLAKKAEPAACP